MEIPLLGELGLAVLERLWSEGTVEAKDVHHVIGEPRGITQSTIQSTLERLRMIVRSGPHGSRHVPGAGSFVVGWREPEVCIGESLIGALDDRCLRAVSAHEDEHRSRGDLWLRSAAGVLAAGHLPATRSELVDALDLATERACDERSCEVIADRLVVAQALLDAARLQVGGGHCLPALDARVSALCALPENSSLLLTC